MALRFVAEAGGETLDLLPSEIANAAEGLATFTLVRPFLDFLRQIGAVEMVRVERDRGAPQWKWRIPRQLTLTLADAPAAAENDEDDEEASAAHLAGGTPRGRNRAGTPRRPGPEAPSVEV